MCRNKLVELRTAIRSNIKIVIDYISLNHIVRGDNISTHVPAPSICMICGNSNKITKEHVIPRWIFEKDPHKFFEITLNGQGKTYNKTKSGIRGSACSGLCKEITEEVEV